MIEILLRIIIAVPFLSITHTNIHTHALTLTYQRVHTYTRTLSITHTRLVHTQHVHLHTTALQMYKGFGRC